MSIRNHTSKSTNAFREIDAARARAAASHASISMLIAPTRRGTIISLDPSEATADHRLPARQAWYTRFAAGWH
ncbi:MAG: hypothetical protein QOK36_4300 [Gaiellales bacterium]|jgi:hypothetical protein|nr:hypothetical protein [Gaiellales bacterium]